MALKGDRVEIVTDISYYKSDAVAERGVIQVHDTGGSGVAMDDALAKVKNVAALSNKPAGLLLCDVVNLTLTRQHINEHKDEVQLGGKVTLLRYGVVTTDQISGTPVVGSGAHFGLDGKLTSAHQKATSDRVGRWLSVKDADGYAKVEIQIV